MPRASPPGSSRRTPRRCWASAWASPATCCRPAPSRCSTLPQHPADAILAAQARAAARPACCPPRWHATSPISPSRSRWWRPTSTRRSRSCSQSGDLRSAVAASMALPALFTPVTRDGRVLMDGGLVNPLPFDVLKGEADITVAIDVSGASLGPRQAPAAHRLLRARVFLADPAALDRAREAEGPAARHLRRCGGRRVPRAGVPPLRAGDERRRPSQGAAQAPARARARKPDRRDGCRPPLRPTARTRRKKRLAGPRAPRHGGAQHDRSPRPARPRRSARASRWRSAAARRAGSPTSSCWRPSTSSASSPSMIAGTSMGAIVRRAATRRACRPPRSARASRACFASRAAFFKRFAGKLRGGISTLWSLRSPARRRQRHAFRDAAARSPALRFRSAQDSVRGDRRRFLRHRAGGHRPRPGDPGAGRELRAAGLGAARGARGPRADRRRLHQSAALRRRSWTAPTSRLPSTSPATRSAAPASRCPARSKR